MQSLFGSDIVTGFSPVRLCLRGPNFFLQENCCNARRYSSDPRVPQAVPSAPLVDFELKCLALGTRLPQDPRTSGSPKQSKGKQSNAKQSKQAMQSNANENADQSNATQSYANQSKQCNAKQCNVKQSKAKQSKAKQAMQSEAIQCKAMQI